MSEQTAEAPPVEEEQAEPDQVEAVPPEETAPAEDTFDRKQAEAKIRKANSEAKNLRERLKALEPLAAELQRIKDAEKTDTERLTEQLTAANERIAATRKRLVRTQVQALASATFADPEDAVGALDLDSFLDAEGDVNEEAIKTELTDLLTRKPHWAKVPESKRPAPDLTQGSGANNKTKAVTPGEEFAGWLHSQLGK